ncbi:DNA excision repair protein ERCC-5 [Anastrepha ludens]|uniref:DNA excision repair protein ERCC-5 n=1 Tax=Anastrepha ludens TaxID=28586 RepID=UPI0023B14047|nr:DNA excision repair protein ERCC-5 [Anastrepha ludens]
MGVTGLWKLVEPCGSPVPVETLEGKILAVDISIWLYQAVKGFQDNKGSLLPHAHLLGLFHRLCKLLYYRVRPVFVFDGCVPQLKRDTIARRQQQRSKLNNEADRIQALLLQSLSKEKVVQQALGINAQLLLKSPSKRQSVAINDGAVKDDIFKLPELPNEEEVGIEIENKDTRNTSTIFETSTSTEDSSFDDSNPWREYNANLQEIDVRSEQFKSLPPEVRHEILVDIKETRKQSSWGRLHELPSCSDDFSSFQMKRLLKRRAVQESIEETEKEMGERALTFTDLQNLFTEDGTLVLENTKRRSEIVCSDETLRVTLVRDLKKNIEKDDKKPAKVYVEDSSQKKAKLNLQPEIVEEKSGSNSGSTTTLSMESDTHIYNQGCEYESNENIKLNRQQRKQLKNSAIGPARAYMIEYGGMNEEEVEEIMDTTQVEYDSENENFFIAQAIAASLEDMKRGEKNPEEMKTNESKQCTQPVEEDISENDSDLEEVVDDVQAISTTESDGNLDIIIRPEDQLVAGDDLFADIFESSIEKVTKIDVKESKQECPEMWTENVETIILDNEECNIGKQTKNYGEDVNEDKNKVAPSGEVISDNTKMSFILDELKKQANDVKNIRLGDVDIGNSSGKLPPKNEIIEIYDSDDQQLKKEITPSKSPKFRTPSKNKSINEYFETKYVVKRTPENNLNVQEEKQSPTVKSPFFVKKTPSSHKKRSVGKINASPVQGRKLSKVSKTLFESSSPTSSNKVVELSKKDMAQLKAEVLLENAASALKEQKTTEQLQTLALDLAKERSDLENERNRQDRLGTAINQSMHTECQELLRLFGIPYIVAPMEAEAQCAFLESVNITHGTITDDSDIWLFGGRTVFKNFFEQKKHVLKFEADKIRDTFNCDRERLIQLACLVGSDYTTGIHGIGTVTALEILATFSATPKNLQESYADHHLPGTVLSALCRFRDWLKTYKDSSEPPGSSARLKLRKKLKNIELNDGFPSPAVVEAYLFPKVDNSKAQFSWGYPDVDSIHEFTKKIFGWTTIKTDEMLKPVLKRINDKQTQASIRNYFSVKSALKSRGIKVSKRVQKAIDTMAGKLDITEAESTASKIKKRNRRNKKQEEVSNSQRQLEADSNQTYLNINLVEDAPSTSTAALARQAKKFTLRLPETKDVIPQRERDIKNMCEKKAKAAAVLRKSAAKATKMRRKNE